MTRNEQSKPLSERETVVIPEGGNAMTYLESLYGDLSLYRVGETVRAFDPRTLGVVKVGTIVKIGRKYATVDFGLSGTVKVAERDLLGHA